MKKRVIKTFKDCGIKITIKGNLKIVNFLDVTFNLHKNTSHMESQVTSLSILIHPSTTMRELPKSIWTRLSELSCKFLKKQHHLTMMPWKKVDSKRTWYIHLKPPSVWLLKQGKRKIIWFNSPYSVNVKTNISKFSKETFYEKEQVTKYFQ